MDLIAFYADNALIKKATSPEETPTPGYLYHEIVGITHKSVEACQNLENVLLSRLENESPIVKLKVLRTIKHILIKGHVSVKRDLMSRVNEIRPSVHVRGPPDQLRGDTLWQSVRNEAQEVLTVIFDTEQRAAVAPVAVSSMGSDHMGTSNAHNNYDENSRMSNRAPVGTYTPSSSSSTFAEANANYRGSSSQSNISSYSGPNSSSSGFAQDIKNKISSLPSKLGNNRPSHELSNFGNISTVSHAGPHTHSAAGSGADWAYTPQASAKSGDEETTLVEDITNSAGNASLTFQALDEFCGRSALLDQNRIADLLLKKLDARAWQSRHKALAAIEALLLSSTGSVIRDTCIDRRVAFEGLLSAMQPTTREKAKQVLTLLGVTVDPNTNATTATPPQASPPMPRVSHDSPAEYAPPSSLFAGLEITPAPSSQTSNSASAPTISEVSLIDVDHHDQGSLVDDRARTQANTSLLSFLEASAKVPPSPAPMRDLEHTSHPDESDDSPLMGSTSLHPQLLGDNKRNGHDANQLIDLGLSPNPISALPPTSPDLLANFRTPAALKSSAPVPASPHSPSSSYLSSSQPIPAPNTNDSFLASLMEAAPPSSLAELLETTGVSFIAPAPSTVSPSAKSTPTTSFSSTPFAQPAKVPMVSNFAAKPTPSTIPQYPPNSAQPNPSFVPLSLTSGFPPSIPPAQSSIRTTSATSVYAPITSVPRAPTNQYSPTHPSSSSQFNFVQQKKQDHFGDLVSMSIQQMSTK